MTGEEYRAIRKSLGWTQLQLSYRLGVDPNTVARRERGESPIDDEAALAIKSLAEKGAG